MVMARFPRGIVGARLPGAQTWLNLVWECNALQPEFFAAASETGDWWAGGTVEEYPDARIVTTDDSVRIVSTSRVGDAIIRQAAVHLGVTVVPAGPDVLPGP